MKSGMDVCARACVYSFPSFLSSSYSKMPKSKKGRLSGGARKELNDRRSDDAVTGKADGITFARVTRMLGANHVSVAIEAKHGQRELRARIPNVLARRGATPITTRDVVALFVGEGFDPDTDIPAGTSFDITAVLSQRQAYKLKTAGKIPSWMSVDVGGGDAADKDDADGFEFDYSGSAAAAAESEGEDASGSDGSAPKFSRKAALDDKDTIDIDAI